MSTILELTLQRFRFTENTTTSILWIGSEFECFVLEDREREGLSKIFGKTAIPRGRYCLRLTDSPRFGRVLPLIEGVPGFSGIRIHAGNGPEDTEGCLLPGRLVTLDRVLESRPAFDALFAKLEAAGPGPHWLTVRGGL
jgi:hypothetical protein